MWDSLQDGLIRGDVQSLARTISLVENEVPGYETFLPSLTLAPIPVIGITGPPGAGKSTLTDALIEQYVGQGKKIAVICIDPSSPFNRGALLGDRIRMSHWYNHPRVFIRSLASRGSLGGLNPKVIEITDVLKASVFDVILVETVGVGQSEVEIAGLADVTVVAIVPEAGDDIQTMKAGLMEIADVFVVNKADRPGADTFMNNLRQMLAPAYARKQIEIPVVQTIASEKKGIDILYQAIEQVLLVKEKNDLRDLLLAEKLWTLIQKKRMEGLSKALLLETIKKTTERNLYKLLEDMQD
ncbi:MAG: methylmalonyl Co-A mutase-associated GTPase MeaB [Ferruginibacter sp.]